MCTALLIDFSSEQGATKEHTLSGSVTEEQRRSGEKATQPGGREHFEASGGVAHSLQVAKDMRVARAWPSASNCSRAVRMGISTDS